MSLIIGIDPGVNTGLAVWDAVAEKFQSLTTLQLHRAIILIDILHRKGEIDHVVYEDARLRKWFGNHSAKKDRQKLQGAGSIKRDCVILQDFLADLNIPHTGIAPQAGATKWSAEQFKKLTGWEGRTSEHARDAALLVFKRKPISRATTA